MAHILVIDDDRMMREMLRDMLEGAGHRVVDAPDGKAGVRHYRCEPADLVITDIMMPEEDGLEMIRELVRDFSDVKIIAISGGDVKGWIDCLAFAREWGASETFTKPFNPAALLKAVEELVNEN